MPRIHHDAAPPDPPSLIRPPLKGALSGAAGLSMLPVCAALLCARPANAQLGGFSGVQPAYGTDTRVGELRPQLEAYFNTGVPTAISPPWILQKGIEVDLGGTDNALQQSRSQKADVFTVISPQIYITGDTARLKVNLSYTPQIREYASTSSQNQIAEFFNGQALATIVPDALFLNLRGNITQQSLTSGGFNQYQTQTFNRQNDVETISFSVNPYAEHRFGSWGTGRLSYSFDRSLQNTQDNQAFNNQSANNQFLNQSGLGTPGYGAVGNLSTQREQGTFTTGENLGRITDTATAQAIQYSGSGSYVGAHRNEIQNQTGFALTRSLTLLAGYGYQDVRYGGSPGVRINQPTYDIGARYSPNPDTSITVEYGKRDGSNQVALDGHAALTARIRVFAQYNTGITTDLEQAQGLLGSTSVGTGGLLTNTATGAPVSGYLGYNGLQNGVYRLKRFSGSVLFLQDRNSYSFSVNNDQRTTLTSTPTVLNAGFVVPAGTTTNSTYASASWQHDLTPDMNTNLTLQYGVTNGTGQYLTGSSQDQTTLSISASLSRQFTATLRGSIRYTFTDQTGAQAFNLNGFNSGAYTANILYFSLNKTF